MILTDYEMNIKNRSKVRFYIGLLIRAYNHFLAVCKTLIARWNGAEIGANVYMRLSLALKSNTNLTIGDNSIIESSDIDLRDKVKIGSNVIINTGVCILRASHKVHSKDFETISNPLQIGDFCWITTNSVILPGCQLLQAGSVLGAGAVLNKSVTKEKQILIGNPATVLKVRKDCHVDVVLPSLQGRDLKSYYKARYS
jgi:acetyltransferase-like isoleucine patch superfamily enzyme